MRRAPLALALSLALTPSAFAQLPSPLDLVRGLRSAGLVDLAILRLGELTAKPGLLTPDEVKLVALEMARIRLEQAARESEDGKRAALLAQARGEFDTFIRDNAGHPMVAQANVDLARLLALQAKTQAGRANRVEGAEAKAAEAAKARPLFTDAIARYQGAIAALEAGLKLPGVKATDAAELTRSRIQAELDAAVLQFDLGLTFSAEGERPQRGDALTKAEKAFNRIGDRYGEQRVGLLAHVWTLQCQFSNGDEVKALKGFADFEVAYRANREASDALRQARFFGIEHIVANDQSKDSAAQRLTKAEQAADRWLKMYPEARGTLEGLGARYRRATLKEARAKLPGGVKVDDKTKRVTSVSAESRLLLTDANAIYKELTETDNEYTDRAQRRRLTRSARSSRGIWPLRCNRPASSKRPSWRRPRVG